MAKRSDRKGWPQVLDGRAALEAVLGTVVAAYDEVPFPMSEPRVSRPELSGAAGKPLKPAAAVHAPPPDLPRPRPVLGVPV